MYISLFFYSLFTVVLLIVLYRKWNKTKIQRSRKKYPPGPGFAIPLLGHLLQLGTKYHLTLGKWKNIYGPLFSFQMGSESAVVVSDPKLAKDLFSLTSTTGRLRSPVANLIFAENSGVANSEGAGWEEQRRFVMRTLKELGVPKGASIEDIIIHEANKLIQFLKERIGIPIQGKRLFNQSIFNTTWTFVSGEKVEVDSTGFASNCKEPLYVKLAGEQLNAFNAVVSTGLLAVPWLRHIFPVWSGWTKLLQAKTDIDNAAYNVVQLQEMSKHPEAEGASNFIQKYLAHIESTTSTLSSFYRNAGKKNLVTTIAEFFMAGSESTSIVLEYVLLYLTQYPHIQKKVQAEVDEVIGKYRLPCLNDQSNLPYTKATIMEIMRLSSVGPLGFPHRAIEDVEFHGYFIPKDTILFVDIYNMHHDADTWAPDPMEFRPERFLNNDKTKVVLNDALMPFGIGRRQCLGETHALNMLFLNITCLLQTFSVSFVDRKVDLGDVIVGVGLMPKPFSVVFNLRSE